MINIKRLKELERLATGGPWMAEDEEACAESRNALPELLAWIERAKPLLETLAQWPTGGHNDEAANLLGELTKGVGDVE